MLKCVLTIQDFSEFLLSLGVSVKRNVFTGGIKAQELREKYSFNRNYESMLFREWENSIFSIKFNASRKKLLEMIFKIAEPYNPIQEMLNSTVWDKEERISMLYEIWGITEEVDKLILKKWLHQCISMALNDNYECCNNIILLLYDFYRNVNDCAKNFFSFLVNFDEESDFIENGTSIDYSYLNGEKHYKAMQERYTHSWITHIRYFQSCGKLFLRHFINISKKKATKVYDIFNKNCFDIPLRTSFCGSFDTDYFWKCKINNINFHSIAHSKFDEKLLNSLSYDWVKQLWAEVYQTMYIQFGIHGYELTEDEIEASQKLQNSLKNKRLCCL